MGGMILPDAEWRHREGLDRLIDVLGDARFVGGSVRDTLLGLPVSDLDVATPLSPQRVIELLKAAGIRVVPTGIDHGTVTVVLESGPVEVTTLRRDVSTDGRRATVAFTDDWREDAARRDFTMNALYADPATGAIFDYFGGLADLEARHVRFIGDPLQRIAEDHLRILRFFRFLARFGDIADPAGLEACTDRANDLMALSRERIADELLKLLVARDAVRVVALMIERGIFLSVLPEITSANRFAHLAARETEAGVAPSAIRRLASLIPADPMLAELIAARLKLSNVQRKRLAAAVIAPEDEPRPLAYRTGVVTALDQLLLSDRPLADALGIRDWQPPRFPLGGGAIVSRGVKAGPEVARLMKEVERRWIDEGFPDEQRVSALADEAVAQALRSVSN
ncbi:MULTISPECIES: CCA tRNA nucleotidyltransferase [unclassified Sphingomonas]|uniref:CCA tRNA nucleotidyltransferase n=1 Tax=unclassified Sphingomonas TaxID=196159 RepID=UPI0022B31416|nr:CCA tRNA nucleotidyltransferase [Sphingomonas sp. NIBR02145]WHU04118.1 CCA tRNA nucleotidyltransferase [Sphingomonas sp. NIBR02145]